MVWITQNNQIEYLIFIEIPRKFEIIRVAKRSEKNENRR